MDKQIEEILRCKKCYKAETGFCNKCQITENAVVLMGEEYEALKNADKEAQAYSKIINEQSKELEEVRLNCLGKDRTIQTLLKKARKDDQKIKQTRKETAEKFAERLKEQFVDSARLCEQVDEIYKELVGGL